MRFFKAQLAVNTNGKTIYGNLPYKFTVGHEVDGYAYFTLTDGVELPDGSDVIVISEEEFQQVIATLQAAEEQRRQQEQSELIDKLSKKERDRQAIAERTVVMQDIDDFTLQQIMAAHARLDELEQRVIALEGGTA